MSRLREHLLNGTGYPAFLLPPEWRTYRLCRLYGCRPPELDELPAAHNDVMLAIDDLYELRDALRARGGRPA